MEDRRIIILYGSQTGTAQDIAERIWREAKFYGFHGPFMSMDDCAPDQFICQPLVLFVAATTGQGEEPDNMKIFWKFLLQKRLPPDSLQNKRFAVLGLGDSSYLKFNFVAKRLTRRLCNLGGIPIVDTGYADDQHDLGADAVIDKWLVNLWTVMGSLFNFSVGPCNITPEPRWNVSLGQEPATSDSPDSDNNKWKDLHSFSQGTPCPLHILENKRTTTLSHFQDVRLLKLKIPPILLYSPGDVLMLAPHNSDRSVKQLFDVLNESRLQEDKIDENTVVQVREKDSDLPVPEPLRCPITLKECAKKYWDLNVVPRRRVFSLLAHVTADEMEKEKLFEFCEAAGQEDLYNYCNRPKRTILEVLTDFPHAARAITLEFLFDVFQPIRPRAFSIASSPKKHQGEIHILLAVVQYKTKLLTPRHGLCSSYLADLPEGSVIHGWIRPGSFRFPPSGVPVIMIGPGTGVAPFRSYIQDVCSHGTCSSSDLLLFFGCRNKDADFHCRAEWETLVDKSQLTLVTAFSRDQSEKVYVQHRIAAHGHQVWDMLSRNGYIFIAGSSKNMPTAVRESFIQVIREHGGMDADKAEAYLTLLERSGRYQTETWG